MYTAKAERVNSFAGQSEKRLVRARAIVKLYSTERLCMQAAED